VLLWPKSIHLFLTNPRYLKSSKLFTCFIFYVEESQKPNYSELQQLKKMQKLCQKRALEVNKLAKSQMAKAPEPEPVQPMDIGSTFKPSVSLLHFSTPHISYHMYFILFSPFLNSEIFIWQKFRVILMICLRFGRFLIIRPLDTLCSKWMEMRTKTSFR